MFDATGGETARMRDNNQTLNEEKNPVYRESLNLSQPNPNLNNSSILSNSVQFHTEIGRMP